MIERSFFDLIVITQEFEQLINHIVEEAASVLCNGYFAF